MTDTRLPEQWLMNRDLDALSDTAWRVFTRALMYCNSQGTDGQIDQRYLRYVYLGSDDPTEYLNEIVRIGWLVPTETGYLIPDWEAKGQSTADQVAEYREKNRLKSQRSRERAKAVKSPSVTGYVTGDVGKERHKDRKGQAGDVEVSWPPVAIPNSDSSVNRTGEGL